MAKKKKPMKTCFDCIYEEVCRMWTDGRYISAESASRCPNHTTVRNSAAYLIGKIDGRKETILDGARAQKKELKPCYAFGMNEEQKARFEKLRKTVAEGIKKELAIDCCCKSYEGTWELFVGFHDYFEDEDATKPPRYVEIRLHCYVLGPSRHYCWGGKDWDEAICGCERDVLSWCREMSRYKKVVRWMPLPPKEDEA